MKHKESLYGSALAHPLRASETIGCAKADPYKTSLFILIGAVLLVAALWSYMSITASAHQTLDQHVQKLGAQLKCPVCQGESVADSPSDRAQEIRAIIRQQIQAGQSDQQIIQYFSDRYGTQIVWSPPWWGFSLLAWLVPVALLLGGLILIFFTLRDWRMPVVSIAANTVEQGHSTTNIMHEEDAELADIDETELAQYRAQLERELANEDALFERPARDNGQMEAR